MTSYPLLRVGQLLATRASLKGRGGIKILTLLVDTGSTYTIIPIEALESIGTSAAESREHVRIVTGSGVLMAPKVKIPAFHCLGSGFREFSVIGHTLPSAGPIDGLLGMDFLCRVGGRIDIKGGLIEVSEAKS